jgi:hypothetical protein
VVRPLTAKQDCLMETLLERGGTLDIRFAAGEWTYTRSKGTENSKEMFRSHRQ